MQVSLPALIKRINRRLRVDDEMLRTTRGERARLDLGDYYVHDFRRNFITEHHVNPEDLGRELGVLSDNERVSEEIG
jgi:hypothetical protein